MKNDRTSKSPQGMPRGSTPLHDRRPQRIEYDDGMRNEEHTYSPLLTEAENADWLIGHVPIDDIPHCGIRACSGFALKFPQRGVPVSALIHSDVGDPPISERDIFLTMEETFLPDPETICMQDVISFSCDRSAPEMDPSLSFMCRVNSSVFDDLSESGGREWQYV